MLNTAPKPDMDTGSIHSRKPSWLRQTGSGLVLVGSLVFGSAACSVIGGSEPSAPNAQSASRDVALWIPSPVAQNSDAETRTAATTVTVQAGDQVSTIAQRLTGSAADWRKLADFNNLDNPDTIQVGDVLNIPPEFNQRDRPPTSAYRTNNALSLVSALRSAQDNDSSFKIAQTSYDIAQQNLPIAQSALKPQAAAQVSAGYTDLFNDRIDPYSDQQIGITASQSLFNKAASRQVAQAKRSASIAQIELLANQEDLVMRVSQAYFDVLMYASELEFRESDLGAIRRQLQQTRRRYDVGEIAVTDVVEAKARYDLAVAAEIQARNRLASSQEALAEITNKDSIDQLMTLQDDIPLVPPAPNDIDYWLNSTQQNNTQIRLARGRQDLAEQQVDVIRAERLPTIGLNGTLASSDSGNDLAQDGEMANVELALQVPITTGGAIKTRVAQEKLRARQATEQLEAAERAANRNTRAAFRDVQAAISSVNALSQALVSTRLAATATRAGFNAGTRTSVELLTAQRDTFRAKADYASARYGYLLSVLMLKRSAGVLEAGDIVAIENLLQ